MQNYIYQENFGAFCGRQEAPELCRPPLPGRRGGMLVFGGNVRITTWKSPYYIRKLASFQPVQNSVASPYAPSVTTMRLVNPGNMRGYS